jgi:hypothetical protein
MSRVQGGKVQPWDRRIGSAVNNGSSCERHRARNRVSRNFDFLGDFQRFRDILAVFVLDPVTRDMYENFRIFEAL